jgi:phosphoribosyl-dephospho-CoA transferase
VTGEAKRHDLVFVRRGAWHSLLQGRTDLAAHPYVAEWVDNRWPLIRRRPLPVETGVALGLPLPPTMGRQRLALNLPDDAICATARPPLLANCVGTAPPIWRDTIVELLEIDDSVLCFGSLAWQQMTGLPYVGPDSDLDLLWTVRDAAHAARLTREIAIIQGAAPVRLDGELLLPSGEAVQWREWLSDARQLLVKSITGVTMAPREVLFL